MMSRSMDMQQLAALAAKGSPDAKMLLNMKRHGVQNQDEQDRRWRNLSYAIDQRKAQGKEPQTAAEYLDVFAHYGYVPAYPLSKAQKASKMRFDQLMAACGGVTPTSTYPAKGEPDAPVKCEGCRKEGADFRCTWCGEWYCSTNCFVADLRAHRPTCSTAVENMHCGMPPTARPELWSAEHYARVYALPPPATTAAAHSSSSSTGRSSSSAGGGGSSSAAGASAAQAASQQEQRQKEIAGVLESFLGGLNLGGSVAQSALGGKGKNYNRNASRRKKQKEQKAAAAAAEGAEPAVPSKEQQQDQL